MGRTSAEKWLRPEAVVGRIRSVPYERLRGDIEVAWPRHGTVASADAAEEGVVGP